MEKIFHVKDNFTVDGLTDYLIKKYQLKGYSIVVNKIGNSIQLEISKNVYGFMSIIGMSEYIRVTYSVSSPSTISVVFSDARWTDKIIVGIIGFICSCGILTATAIIGAFFQISLQNAIAEDINVYAISN